MADPSREETGETLRSFEHAYGELERLVARLEGGQLSLDEGLDAYERGVSALKRCYRILDAAEKRLELLVRREDGTLVTEPFEPASSEPSGAPETPRGAAVATPAAVTTPAAVATLAAPPPLPPSPAAAPRAPTRPPLPSPALPAAQASEPGELLDRMLDDDEARDLHRISGAYGSGAAPATRAPKRSRAQAAPAPQPAPEPGAQPVTSEASPNPALADDDEESSSAAAAAAAAALTADGSASDAKKEDRRPAERTLFG